MRKITGIAVPAAAAAIAAACILTGCSSNKNESSAAESEAAVATETDMKDTADADAGAENAEESEDAKAIAALNPVKPASLGTVKLGDLSTIKITAPLAQTIEESDVDEYINTYVLPNQTKDSDVVKDGDTVNIDFVGKIDGEAFEGGTAEGYDLKIGSGAFIEGFEEGLIGAKKGDKLTLNLKFPDDYQAADYAGKEVAFDVTVNSVKTPITLEDFDDKLADEYSGGTYKTAGEYRDGVRKALEASAEDTAKGELLTNALDEATKISEVELADGATDWEIDLYLQNYDKSLSASYGMGLADMLGYYGQTYEQFRSSLEADAEASAKQSAVVQKIADENGLKYSEETLKEYLDDYGYSEDLIKNSTTEGWIEETVLQYLAGKYICDKAEIKYVPYDEYEAMMESAENADSASAAESTESADSAETAESTAAK